MKGIGKAIKRTPFMVTSKVGMSKKSADPEFDEHNRNFTAMEGAAEALLKDSKAFAEAVTSLLQSGTQFSIHFNNIFSPFSNEHSLEAKHPDAAATIRNISQYQTEMEELRMTLSPELELIESRVVGPVKELQNVLKLIRKNITKRDHKLVDFDRFNNSLTKLRDKKEKTLNDEKNLFKLEQDFEQAMNEYETYNNALKTDMPTFMRLAAQFINPLFHSFYYMQLNIFYLMLEKLQGFGEKKFQLGGTGQEIVGAYEEKRGDYREQVEALAIIKRQHTIPKTGLGSGSGGLGRSASTATGTSSLGVSRNASTLSGGSIGRAGSTASSYGSLAAKKGMPPPPPSSSAMTAAAPPPPYSAGGAAAAAATKRAPPPPPIKPKPAPSAKPVEYVTALYDYEAQAEGDLSFKAGDKIELVEKSDSAEDWWTGKLRGQQGVFPGNYVQL
ncbi:hypothetical protein FRB94_005869 [Tulasnella sp. JGI-2019a]|nr:hypothetical protein FRB94_005869 [Tulasnella sp. JGI-2019a]KAG9007939.1 hypothetical protein FRB93_006958 [Tulasnella sp. JGI-2019a]